MDLIPKDAELVIGLVARIGVDITAVVEAISAELALYNYNVHQIRLTHLLSGFEKTSSIPETPIEGRVGGYIEFCNNLRKDTVQDIMAVLAMIGVIDQRSRTSAAGNLIGRNAYILNQLKRPEESALLRKVYGEHYVQISCHAEESIRLNRLIGQISNDHPEDPRNSEWDLVARRLIYRDEAEEGVESGQRVGKVFPLSDVIIDANATNSIGRDIERFFRALFGDSSVTPTREEYGMQLANVAAQRSSDSSRQVGAAIISKDMHIKALGCNEVPRAFGGTYWEGDDPDGRDFVHGYDANDQRREAVIIDLVMRLQQIGMISKEIDNPEMRERLFNRSDKIVRNSQIMDSGEYGRTVHAEMNALMDAAACGHAVRDCVLYSNTFPCHNCAKHIVGSGITEVIYVHPYPKSYASQLFADSIAVNTSQDAKKKVAFRHFIGIVGPMYARVFTKEKWKEEGGRIPKFAKITACYIRQTPVPAYDITERLVINRNMNKITAAGLRMKPAPVSQE